MIRQIIEIDENLCDGCGLCIPNCPEGALQVIDGKARLISDLFCDGLGACIGHCPQGAIIVNEREAEEYDEYKVMENIIKQGKNVIKAHLVHLKEHNEIENLKKAEKFLQDKGIENPIIVEDKNAKQTHNHSSCGCQGSKEVDMRKSKTTNNDNVNVNLQSELRQWPIQLHLINPSASYFQDADLLICADCVPFTYANFHREFLKDKILIMFCPKLDDAFEQYLEKLSIIFANNNIKSISLVHMEVPCCFGVQNLVSLALSNAKKSIPITDYTISIQGEIKKTVTTN